MLISQFEWKLWKFYMELYEIIQIKAENCIRIYCQTHVIQDNGRHYG